MALIVEHRWWVAGAGIVGALVLFWMLKKGRSWRWRAACVGLPGAAAVLMAMALAQPAIAWERAAKHVVILLDMSGSTRISPWRNPAWLKNLVERRLGEGEGVTVVGFGEGEAGQPRILLDDVPVHEGGETRWPSEWEKVGGGDAPGGTDVGRALSWRSASEARGAVYLAPRWVITDGLVDGEVNAGRQAFEIGWTAEASRETDVGVVELQAHGLGDGSGTEISARVAATGAASAILEITRAGQNIARQSITFAEPGSRWISVRDLGVPGAKPESVRYEISVVRSPAADAWPENDRASILFLPPAEAPRVLIVGEAEGMEALEGFHRGVVPAGQFPGDLAGLLAERWQVIVLNDVPLEVGGREAPHGDGGLPLERMGVLNDFVRQTGGGLLILGREHAFGPGHYLEGGGGPGTLEGLSPVSSQQLDRPAARLIFVLDASGSMNESASAALPERKFLIAARGVEAAMEMLLDQDQITILTFNDHSEKLAQGSKAELFGQGGGTALRRRLDQIRPTGNTLPDKVLPEIEQAAPRPVSKGGPTMVVLLTDGEIPAMDVAAWTKVLHQGGASLAIVAPPPDSAASTLSKLAAATGALWLPTNDAGEWAALLKRVVARQVTGQASTERIPWRTMTSGEKELSGVTTQSIRVWTKTDAREIATGVAKDGVRPMAAAAQRGLGKVGAIAMGPAGDAGAYGQLLQRMTNDVMPPPGDRRFTLAARRDGNGWIVTADGVDGGRFMDGESLMLRLSGGDSMSEAGRQIDLAHVGPGRYEGRVERADFLSGLVVRRTAQGEQFVGKMETARIAGDEWPASFERSPVVSPEGVQAISADLRDSERWNPRVLGVRTSLAEWFWIGAALAALGALWLRRGPVAGARS